MGSANASGLRPTTGNDAGEWAGRGNVGDEGRAVGARNTLHFVGGRLSEGGRGGTEAEGEEGKVAGRDHLGRSRMSAKAGRGQSSLHEDEP